MFLKSRAKASKQINRSREGKHLFNDKNEVADGNT